MARSAAHKTDSPRRVISRDVLGTPAHRVAEITDGTLHTHVEGDTRTVTPPRAATKSPASPVMWNACAPSSAGPSKSPTGTRSNPCNWTELA